MKPGFKTLPLLALQLAVACAAVHTSVQAQQMYKWVAPDGKVTYSDQPPPSNAKQLEARGLSGDVPTADLPQVLADAVRRNPVTLYTSSSCGACDSGRNLLKSSGIPFSEKTVKTSEDTAKLQQVSGASLLPFIQIGSSKMQGYEQGEWHTRLAAAGYPDKNLLPKDYRFPAAEPAAPLQPPAPPTVAQPNKPAEPKKTTGGSDFRF